MLAGNICESGKERKWQKAEERKIGNVNNPKKWQPSSLPVLSLPSSATEKIRHRGTNVTGEVESPEPIREEMALAGKKLAWSGNLHSDRGWLADHQCGDSDGSRSHGNSCRMAGAFLTDYTQIGALRVSPTAHLITG